MGRAAVLEALGRYHAAATDYTAAIALPSPPPEAYFRRALTRLQMGDPAGAAKDLLMVTRRDPENSEAFEKLGRCQAALGKYKEAGASYSKALELYPWNADALQGRAEVVLAQGKVEDAIRDCHEALAIAPSMVSAYVTRGLAYGNKKDYPRMASDFSRAILLDPKNASNYGRRARAYMAMGKLSEARRDALSAIKLQPKQREYRELLESIDALMAPAGE